MTDPISDMLTIIKNGYLAQKEFVDVSFSKLKFELAKILLKNGFVESADINSRGGRAVRKFIRVGLKYDDERRPAVSGIKRISKPGQRVYKGYGDIRFVKSGYGVAVISTSKGLLSDKEARKKKIGGEVICEIW